MRGQRHRQSHAQQPRDRHTHEDRAHDDAPDVEDQDCRGTDPDQDHGIDDPLHHDGTQRRAAADALAVAQVVAPNQLAEAGRQDVVGEVADEHIGAQAAERHAADRPDQDLPAQRPEDQVRHDARDRKKQPCGPGAAEQIGGLAQVHFPQNEVDASQRDEDADAASSQVGGQASRHARSPVREEGVRSLGRTVRAALTGPTGFDSPACGYDALAIDAAGSAGRPSGWRARTRRCAGN